MKNKQNMKKSKFNMTFKKALLIYAGTGMLIIITGLFFFYDFLYDYEKSMPTYGMDYPLSRFREGDVTELADISELKDISGFIGAEEVLQKYNRYITGKEITMIKSKGFIDTKPVYDVRADGKTVAKVHLKSEKKKSSGFKTWTFEKMEIREYAKQIAQLKNITVTAPDNVDVSVNGIKLPKDGGMSGVSVEKNERELLANVKKYTDTIPDMLKYTVEGVPDDASVKVSGEDGTGEREAVKDEAGGEVYYAAEEIDEKFMQEAAKYADQAVVAYAENFINLRKKLLPYIMPASDLYKSIRSTTTSWYPNEEISGYDFDKKDIRDIRKYSDDCFSCRVEYVIRVTFKEYSVKDTTEDGNFTWYFVKREGKWYLTDMNYE